MCDGNSKERYKKLYLADEDPKASHEAALEEEEDRILKSLADCLIVHKITGNEKNSKEPEDLCELHTLRTAELYERKNLANDYEAVVRKELQMLQADERGKRALQSEIAEIKKQQMKRAEALKAREKALRVEKERARRVASRPPPLPKSVVMLLKEHEKKQMEAAAEEMLQVSQHFIDAEEEDKENVMDEKAEAERMKLQAERDARAKQRFNEAIRKEHQKQEHAEILKDIENAEKLNRRQLAKSVAIKGGRVPCLEPDNVFHIGQQVAMEDKVESIFKNNPKEHAVEDLEGYEDYWETKYKKIDSKMEERMIDCVPSFVKDNYAYLLEDESALRVGRRFSGLDESRDELNTAYIGSPRSSEELDQYGETDAIISHLDQMQKETNEKIEKEFKPLLKAKDAPKAQCVDKSVGTDILKRPTEHKAVGVHSVSPEEDQVTVGSKSVGVDFMNGGLMGYKRSSRLRMPRDFRSPFASPESISRPAAGQESWSSSSYWSLPSKHGLPNMCNLCDSPNCNVPLIEHVKSCIPLSKGTDTSELIEAEPQNNSGESNSTLTSDSKTRLSYYVQMVADKYLKNPYAKSAHEINTELVATQSSENESREMDATRNSFLTKEPTVHETPEVNNDQNFAVLSRNAFSEASINLNPRTDFVKMVQTLNCQVSKQNLPKSPAFTSKKSLIIDMDEPATDDVFVQKCHEVISDNLSDMFSHLEPAKAVVSAEVCYTGVRSDENELSWQPYVYHELSTIQELDSALTNDGNRSTSKRSLNSTGNTSGKCMEKMSGGSDRLNITPISLVDAPPAAVSELAKSIQFIKKASPKKAEHVFGANRVLEERAKTPSSVQMSEPTMQSFTIDDVSGYSKTSGLDYGSPLASEAANSGTNSLLTPNFQSVHCSPQRSAHHSVSPRHFPPSAQPHSSSNELSPRHFPSTSHSPQSTTSQEPPQAHAFSSPYKNQYHLNALASLPKYFPDISSIRQGSSSTCSSQYGGSQSSKATTDDQDPPLLAGGNLGLDRSPQKNRYESSAESFKPLTPHSYISGPSEIHESHPATQRSPDPPESCPSSFFPLTPRSYTSSFDSKESVEIPQNVSSHIRDQTNNSCGNGFRPLTPHLYLPGQSSYTSSLNSKESVEIPQNVSPHIRDQANDSCGSGFRPLTPHLYLPGQSDFSSQSELVSPAPSKFRIKRQKKSPADLRLKVLHSIKNTVGRSFEPPISLSSVQSFMEKSVSLSADSPVCRPVKFHLYHKAHDLANSNNHCVQHVGGDGSHLKLPSTLKTRLGDLETGITRNTVSPEPPQKLPEKKSPKAVKACDSGGFNPQWSAKDLGLASLMEDSLHDSQAVTPKQGAKVCNSEFFNPCDMEEFEITPSKYSKVYNTIQKPKGAEVRCSEFFSLQRNKSESGGVVIQNSMDIEQNSPKQKSQKPAKVCSSEYFYPRIDGALQKSLGGEDHEVITPKEKQCLKGSKMGRPHFFADMPSSSIKGGLQEENPIQKQEHQKGAKMWGSEFFRPYLSVTDFGPGEICIPRQKPKELPLGLTSVCSLKSSGLKAGKHPIASPARDESKAAQDSNDSPNLILDALKKKFLLDDSGKLSSHGSRISYQSTPTKTIEAFMQETGILDEPDLTLVNTNFSIKPERPISESQTSASALDYNFSSASPCKSAMMRSHCESPSMLSFLQHEQSCMLDAKVGASAGSVSQAFKGDFLEQKKIAASPTPSKQNLRCDYKSRTKRLWNNLEEVRKRKLMEEKREQMLKNRLKMKTYSKNLTTPMKKP